MYRTVGRHRFVLAAAVVGLVAGLSACSGQASSDTPPSASVAALAPLPSTAAASASASGPTGSADTGALPTIADSEFQIEATKLCTANAEAVRGAFMAMGKPPAPEEMRQAFGTLVAESYRISDELAALGAPPERQAALIAVIEANDRITAEVEAAGPDAFFADQGDAYADLYPLMERLQVPACLPQEE